MKTGDGDVAEAQMSVVAAPDQALFFSEWKAAVGLPFLPDN